MKIKNKLYISHGPIPCLNLKDGYNYLYLTDVLDECINFLNKHTEETIIIHLKKENIKDNVDVISVILDNLSMNVPNTNLSYNNFVYIGDSIPKIGQVRGKIVIVTREKYQEKTIKCSN